MTEQERIEKAKAELQAVLEKYNVVLQPKIVNVSGTLIISLVDVDLVAR